MSKRKFDALVPDHFKELIRSALQKPKPTEQIDAQRRRAPTEISSRQNESFATSAASSSAHVLSSNPPPPPPPPPPHRPKVPMIPSSSFYSAKNTALSPPLGCAAGGTAHTSPVGESRSHTSPAEPAYLRLIQLYKKRCSLFGAERRQHCFQMFAKLKEALEFATQQSNCHVFAQEGAQCHRPLLQAQLLSFICLTLGSELRWVPLIFRLQGLSASHRHSRV
jgi:hypothetical protein